MNIIRVIIVLICLLNVTNHSNAQVSNKIKYRRVAQNNSIWPYVFRFYGINGSDYEYVRNELVKLYGEDSLKNADNKFKITHTVDSLLLWDIQGVKIESDSHIRIYGTYYIKSYDLGEDKNKKVIMRENDDGVKAIMKVFEDEEGKKYIKKWHLESYIDLHDTNLRSIEVINRNKWFYTEKEKNMFVYKYQLARYPIQIGITTVAIALMARTYLVLRQ